ncbi:hypothetical protein H0H87_002495, partial [Tephrocybe sp. NHM501043]
MDDVETEFFHAVAVRAAHPTRGPNKRRRTTAYYNWGQDSEETDFQLAAQGIQLEPIPHEEGSDLESDLEDRALRDDPFVRGIDSVLTELYRQALIDFTAKAPNPRGSACARWRLKRKDNPKLETAVEESTTVLKAHQYTKEEAETFAKVLRGYHEVSLGFALVPVAQLFSPEDFAPRDVPELIRYVYNPRVATRADCENFFKENGQGGLLDTNSVQHAITIVVDKSTIELSSVTFQANMLHRIAFKEEYQGLTKDKATAEQEAKLWVLADGGHRTGSIFYVVLEPLFKALKAITSQIDGAKKKMDSSTGQQEKATFELHQKLVSQRQELLTKINGETWVANMIDREALGKHEEKDAIIAYMSGNRSVSYIPETESSVLVKLFDYLNQTSDPGNPANITKSLSILTGEGTPSVKKMRASLFNIAVTKSYARACLNPVLRARLDFPSSALDRYRRVTSVYVASWINYMALFYEVLFSSSPHVNWGRAPSERDEDRAMRIAMATELLQRFDESKDDKQIRTDICDTRFVDAMASHLKAWKRVEFFHGLEKMDMDEATATQWTQAMSVYFESTDSSVNSWIGEKRAQYANDSMALEILDSIRSKLEWLSTTDIAAPWIPATGRSPYPHTEFILSVAKSMDAHAESQVFLMQVWDGAAFYALRQQMLSAFMPTISTMMEDLVKVNNPKFTSFERRRAVNAYLAVLYRRRNTSLAEMTSKHGRKPPAFMADFPHLTTVPTRGSEPELFQIHAVTKIVTAIVGGKPEDEIEELYEDESLCGGTGEKANQEDTGSMDGRLEGGFENQRHKRDSENSTSDIDNDQDHEAFPALYLGNRTIRSLVDELLAVDGWKKSWYKLRRAPALTQEEAKDETDDLQARIAEAPVLDAMDSLALDANKIGHSLRNLLRKSAVFSCSAIQLDGTPAIVLKPSALRILKLMHEMAIEELEETSKHVLITPYKLGDKLSAKNKAAIAERLEDFHIQKEQEPTLHELFAWHSADNMVEVIRAQIDPDPELTRLMKQREKREAQRSMIKAEDGETTSKQRTLRHSGKGKAQARATSRSKLRADEEAEYLRRKDQEDEAYEEDVVMKDLMAVPDIITPSDLEAY